MGHTGSILDERESLIKYCEGLYFELFGTHHDFSSYDQEELRENAYILEEGISDNQYNQRR